MDSTLKENVPHGTPQKPMAAMHFQVPAGSACPDHFFVRRHWHDNVEMIKILRGTFKVEIDLEEDFLEPGDICIVGGGKLHQLRGFTPGSIHDVFLFHPGLLSFAYNDGFQEEVLAPWLEQKFCFPQVIRKNSAEYKFYGRYVSELIDLGLEAGEDWYFRCKMKLLDFLYQGWKGGYLLKKAGSPLSPGEREMIDRYKRTVSFIEENFSKKLTLDDIAGAARCSSPYLCRFFKNMSGYSPVEYLIFYRVHQAAAMLEETTKNILEISMDCGFDNTSYFIRKFRQIMGMTPGQYRKTGRVK